MAALLPVRKSFLQTSIACLATRGIHTSSILHKKRLRSGSYKSSPKQNIPLTYEEAKRPHLIGVDKSWLTWNTSNLLHEERKSEAVIEDAFIRRFLDGTWQGRICSEVVIKRRHNMIYLAYYIAKRNTILSDLQRIYFLIGYSEELLSCFLKCPVKLEIQTVDSDKDMIFKYI